MKDATGNIWFATDEKGVLKYDGRRFTQFNTENGFPSNIVYT
jgi:ligand-binding sensor domain-containing protein